MITSTSVALLCLSQFDSWVRLLGESSEILRTRSDAGQLLSSIGPDDAASSFPTGLVDTAHRKEARLSALRARLRQLDDNEFEMQERRCRDITRHTIPSPHHHTTTRRTPQHHITIVPSIKSKFCQRPLSPPPPVAPLPTLPQPSLQLTPLTLPATSPPRATPTPLQPTPLFLSRTPPVHNPPSVSQPTGEDPKGKSQDVCPYRSPTTSSDRCHGQHCCYQTDGKGVCGGGRVGQSPPHNSHPLSWVGQSPSSQLALCSLPSAEKYSVGYPRYNAIPTL